MCFGRGEYEKAVTQDINLLHLSDQLGLNSHLAKNEQYVQYVSDILQETLFLRI